MRIRFSLLAQEATMALSNKALAIMQATDSPQIYKKARKRYLENRGISCAFCPYHRKENQDHKYQRSWKKYRKTKFKGEE
jgi:hypothetical protein